MALNRFLCGAVAIALGVASLQADAAESRPSTCTATVVRIGPLFVTGCWRHVGGRLVARLPVKVDGMKLAGGGTITASRDAGTLRSSGSVRWLIGPVQIRRARFTWRSGTPLTFHATGGVRGLKFSGNGTLRFTGAQGGTALYAAEVAFTAFGGTTVSGATVLKVSRNHAFSVQKVHITVSELALERLLFKNLDFQYANNVWSADAAVRLPAFTITSATVDGHIEIANGAVRDIAIAGSGLTVPLGEGFVLTRARLSLDFHPVVIQGGATATYGPPIAGATPLQIDGALQYSSEGRHWDANGSVTLPWGLPGVRPSVTVDLGLDPGRSMTFKGHLDLTVHGFGITGDLQGFASPSAFNVEGDATLAFPPLNLKGDALISSRGMSACGRVRLHAFGFGVGVGPRLGFGYHWGGSFRFIASSCDVGPFSVAQPALHFGTLQTGPTTVTTSSPAEFAVFAVQGQGDFQVSGPTGTFSTGPTPTSAPNGDRDEPDSFVFHDPSDNTVYLAIPVLETPDDYAVTTLAGAPVPSVAVADGITSLAGHVTGGVAGSGRNLTLTYQIDSAGIETLLQSGESISFYEGQSQNVAGSNPIAENVTSNGTASFSPEPTGDTNRTVRAVVFDADGVPREQLFIASFTTTDVPPPTAAVFIRAAASPPGGWTILLLKPQRVAAWEVTTTTDDGRHDSVELPGNTTSYPVVQGTATHVSAQVTPVDQYGREGPNYLCDSTKSTSCPAG